MEQLVLPHGRLVQIMVYLTVMAGCLWGCVPTTAAVDNSRYDSGALAQKWRSRNAAMQQQYMPGDNDSDYYYPKYGRNAAGGQGAYQQQGRGQPQPQPQMYQPQQQYPNYQGGGYYAPQPANPYQQPYPQAYGQPQPYGQPGTMPYGNYPPDGDDESGYGARSYPKYDPDADNSYPATPNAGGIQDNDADYTSYPLFFDE